MLPATGLCTNARDDRGHAFLYRNAECVGIAPGKRRDMSARVNDQKEGEPFALMVEKVDSGCREESDSSICAEGNPLGKDHIVSHSR